MTRMSLRRCKRESPRQRTTLGKMAMRPCTQLNSRRVNGKAVNVPEVGEIVLVVGEEKNRSEWKKGKVVRQVKGKDGVTRDVVLLHKGQTIELPLQLVCPLELRCTKQVEERKDADKQKVENKREKRGAAVEARKNIRELANNEDAD